MAVQSMAARVPLRDLEVAIVGAATARLVIKWAVRGVGVDPITILSARHAHARDLQVVTPFEHSLDVAAPIAA